MILNSKFVAGVDYPCPIYFSGGSIPELLALFLIGKHFQKKERLVELHMG